MRACLFACLLLTACQPRAKPEPAPDLSSTAPPYLHPAIIHDLATWPSDTGDQVVAINLTDAQHSNRYFGEVQTETHDGVSTLVSYLPDEGQFSYQYVGRTDDNVHVLRIDEASGGSATFVSLMFVTFARDHGLAGEPEAGRLTLNRPRLLIRKLGELPLGDRYDGQLKVEGNRLFIGKDTGWFAQSGGTGGGGRAEDAWLLLDFDL